MTQEYNEIDFIYRYASAFETSVLKFETSHFNIGDNSVTLKHWRNWDGHTDIPRPKNWKESFEQPYNWLTEDEDKEKYFISIWCRLNEWRYLLQFGTKQGQDPFINSVKTAKLPFLYSENKRISGLRTESSKRLTNPQEDMICRLIGEETDVFNIAIFHMRKS